MRRLVVVAMGLLVAAGLGSAASAATLSSEASYRATLAGDLTGGATLLLHRDGSGSLSVKAYQVTPQTSAQAGIAAAGCDVGGTFLVAFRLRPANANAVATGSLSLTSAQIAAISAAIAANKPLSVRVLAAGGSMGCGDLVGHPGVATGRIRGTVTSVGAVYDIGYPIVSGISEDAGLAVNGRLFEDANATVVGFAADAEDAGKPAGGFTRSTGTQTFSVSLSRPTLLSLGEVFNEYRTGAAHGFATISTYTFDLTDGHLLALSDLLRPGYLSILSAESRTRLRALLGSSGSASVIDAGTTAKASNFTGWQLEASGLRITFGEFQVGPHSVGLPSIVIPWASLRSVVNFSSPIAAFVSPGACTAGQLKARMSFWEGGVGSRFNTLRVVNGSNAVCFLQGKPEPLLIDGGGHVILQGGPATTTGAKIVLAPGAAATISVVTNNYCGPTPKNPLRVVLNLPASGGRVVGIPAPEGSTVDDLPPCNGPLAPNVIDIIIGWHHA